jgi:hypothetical protein
VFPEAAALFNASVVLPGLLGLTFVVLMAIGDAGTAAAFGPIGHGGTGRMIDSPVMLWAVAFGGYLLGTVSPGNALDTTAKALARGGDGDV